jgi:hypothetical protein
MVRGWQLTACAMAWPRKYWKATTYQINKWENNIKMDKSVGC